MKSFKIRSQGTGPSASVREPKDVRWLEINSGDMRIVVDGSHSRNSLQFVVEANGITYQLTDVLLEIALGKVAEEFSSEYLNFNTYQD